MVKEIKQASKTAGSHSSSKKKPISECESGKLVTQAEKGGVGKADP